MLKYMLDSLDGVDESLHSLYKDDGNGTFLLQVEGHPNEAKLKEFRTNNIQLQKNNKELRSQLEAFGDDVTPESIQAMRDQLEKLEGDGTADEKQQAIFETRMKEIKATHAKELAAKEEVIAAQYKDVQASKRALQDFTIERDIVAAVNATAKPRKGALNDILARARGVWGFDADDILVAHDAAGEPRFGPKGDPLTTRDWVNELVETAPHLFDVQGGGNADGDGGSKPRPGARTIDGRDPSAFGANLADIAAGRVKVQ